jgi:hypothetical protein
MSEPLRFSRAAGSFVARGHATILALVGTLVPILALSAGAPALAGPIFGDGFEVGSVCYWSDSAPTFPCGSYQTCADADGDVWGCFELPFSAPPVPLVEDGEWLPPAVDAADVYVLFDRSGDMLAERTSLRDNLGAVQNAVTCPPLGTGTPGSCYPDLWMGVGLINYVDQAPAFQNFLDLQPAPDFASVPISEPAGCCEEAWLLSAWAAVTSQGSATSGCPVPGTFGPRSSCVGSPAQTAGFATFGYPCFRSGAVSILILPGAEDPSGTLKCPAPLTVSTAAASFGVRIVGLLGSGAVANTATLLQTLAIGTGAVDPDNGNAPLVFPGADAAAAVGVETALLTARSLFKYASVEPQVVDDPNDTVDITTEFVDHVEALDGGAPECTTGLSREDRDLDGFPETFLNVPFGSTLCFRIVANENATVPGTTTTQNFPGSLELTLDDAASPEAALPLLFLVPPG